MTRPLAGPLLAGIAGTVALLALSAWQLERLEWKRSLIAEIDARIAAAPVVLPAEPDPAEDRFLPVEARGHILAEALRVVTTDRGGPAFRIVSPFETGGRVVLLDRGVVPVDAPVPVPPEGEVTVTGNLHWPDERDAFTPPPDTGGDVWYARDVDAMAARLGTEPVLIVARELPGDTASPRPIDTAGIPNDHLGYAVTWLSLAAIWAGMTAVLLWRIRRRIG